MVKNYVDYVDEIKEFNEKGFARISSRFLYYIRTNNISDIKFFKVGTTNSGKRGSIKYSSLDVFGDRYDYCFDIRRKKEFVDFLVAKFFNDYLEDVFNMIEFIDKSHMKPRSEIKNIPDGVIEFEMVGFARPSDKLLDYLREQNILFKTFNPAKTKGSSRANGPIKVIGDCHKYYYKIECREEFIDFLVQKLYKKNPDPELIIRKAFTYILHDNGLHWDGCCFENKKKLRKNKENIKNEKIRKIKKR